MPNYLIAAPASGWKDLKQLAEMSGVSFAKDQLKLGEELIARNPMPELWPTVVRVDDCYWVSSIGRMLESEAHTFGDVIPVHPVAVLVLVAGMHDAAVRKSIWTHMQYPIAVSPYLLTHSDGSNYVLGLKHDYNTFTGRFVSLKDSDSVPRCAHIWAHQPGKEPTELMFRKGSNGKYGHYYS